MQKGAPIVPVWTFGNNTNYRRVFGPNSLLAKLSKAADAPLVVRQGMGGVPYSNIPSEEPMLCVIGDVFPIAKVAEPTRDQVAAVH